MKLSLDWIGDYVELPESRTAQEIADALTMATVEVEQVTDLAAPLAHVVVAEVEGASPHPDADRLAVVRCDAGGDEPVDVVYGGPPVEPSTRVALALPGAMVRRGGDGELTIEARAVRGVESGGMICGASDLGLEALFPFEGDEPLLDLGELDAAPGDSLAAAIGFADTVLEIDNKSLTNRPDLLGHRGIARELAAIFDVPLAAAPTFEPPAESGGLSVEIDDPGRCHRYTATLIEGVDASISPFWLRSRLVKVEQKPINVLVDLSNYVMLAVGQPSHPFDETKLEGGIHVRQANEGEEIELLDGDRVTVGQETLVVADRARGVALAGVKGGLSTGIEEGTRRMMLEIGNWEPSQVRRTAATTGVRTEASMRFEKRLDPLLIDDALAMFVDELSRLCPGAEVTGFVDNFPAPVEPVAVETTVGYINRRLGSDLTRAAVAGILERLGFEVGGEGDALLVGVPSWRGTGDVSLPEDLVEEVGRLYGYENLDFVAPEVKLKAAIRQPAVALEREIREFLAGPAAMQEIVSYPWVDDRYLEAAGCHGALALATPPAPQVRSLQPSLVPQLLAAVASNLRFAETFRLFEVARVFPSGNLAPRHEGGEPLPDQPKHVAGAFVGSDAEELFLAAKGVLEALGRGAQMEPLVLVGGEAPPWAEPSGACDLAVGERIVGGMGVVSAKAMRMAGIRRARAALFEVDLTQLRRHPSRQNAFEPIPTFPQKEYDLSLLVPREIRWVDLERALAGAHELVRAVALAEEYRGAQVPAGKKSLLVRVTMGSPERTLEAKDVDAAAAAMVAKARERFGAELRAG